MGWLYSVLWSQNLTRPLPSPYAAPIERNRWRFMAAVMVFADCRFSESQPILDFVPFVVGIAKPIGSVTTRALYGQLVFEGIGYSGFAVLNFCEGCRHFFLLLDGSPVFRNLSACFPDYLFRDSYKLHLFFMGFGCLESLAYGLEGESQTFKFRS